MAVAEKQALSWSEYLALERSGETKHELVGGVAYAMAGGEPEHARLSLAMGAELRAMLRGRGCRVYGSDLKVRVPASGNCYYPDVSVVCGPLHVDPDDATVVTNPSLLVEVLSPSTERFDRGDKFADYRALPTLRHYVLVSAGRRRIEHYRRNGDGTWTLTVAESGDVVGLADFGGALSVDAVYDG